MSRAAVFLDRDGTINVEKRYLYRDEDWEWIAGAIDAIKMFNTNGFHEHHSILQSQLSFRNFFSFSVFV